MWQLVSMKLLVKNKTIPYVKQIRSLCVISKVSNRKTLCGKIFCFHVTLSIFKFCVLSNFNIGSLYTRA